MNNEKDNFPQEQEEEKKKKRFPVIFFTVIGILLILGGAAYTGYHFYTVYEAQQQKPEVTHTVEQIETLVDNPIDFETLQSQNGEIYSWLIVPGTEVDYPIVQNEYDDSFYLKHSALDKSWLDSGAVYTEMHNSLDFTDRVTVIYGHNGYGNTMFTTLHNFEDEEFFKDHEFFYIYTPDSKLTYEIVSAFKYDDRHIMNSFDFSDDEVFLSFTDMIMNPESTNKNVRESLGKTFTVDDNVVVLSTCITHQRSNRYLVCGVLVNNEKTN